MATNEIAAQDASLRDLARRFVAENKVANIVVAIGGPEGSPDYICAGQQDLGAGPEAGPDTLYRIYSMTKLITGCAIMMLVEDKALTLDTPLAEIFPQFAEMKVLTDPQNSLATRRASKPILIRHLLTHSAGFSYSSNSPAGLKALYVKGGGETARATPAVEGRRPPDLLSFAEAVAKLPLMYEPGTSWHYSIALDVAGAVIEKLAGMPYSEFLQTRLLSPLGMTDTSFIVPPSKLDRLCSNYQIAPEGLELVETGAESDWARPPRFPAGGSGLVSSARDFSRFMAMLLREGEAGGERVLAAKTAQLMMSDMMAPGVMASALTEHSGYGAGGNVVVRAIPGGEAKGTFGWTGAAGTLAFVDRETGFYTVLMTQVMGWYPSPLHAEFTRTLYAALRDQ
jgi:CubicO group peptidase (beta-lactamase class C family)